MNLYEQIGEEKIDELVIHMYDDIIPNDDRINILFNDGFDKVSPKTNFVFDLNFVCNSSSEISESTKVDSIPKFLSVLAIRL